MPKMNYTRQTKSSQAHSLPHQRFLTEPKISPTRLTNINITLQNQEEAIAQHYISTVEKEKTLFKHLLLTFAHKIKVIKQQRRVVEHIEKEKIRCATEAYVLEQEKVVQDKGKKTMYGLNKNDVFGFWKKKQKIMHLEYKPYKIVIKNRSEYNKNDMKRKIRNFITRTDFVQNKQKQHLVRKDNLYQTLQNKYFLSKNNTIF